MSILSEQCEELRAEAERIGYWNPTASRLMFDAADILWSLRNKNVALLGENESLQAENDKLRKLVRCLVNAGHPSDRATLIANAADMLAELGAEVDE